MSAVLRVMARSLVFKLTAGCALMYVLVIVCLEMSGYKETVFKAMFQGSIVVYQKAAAAKRQTTPTWNQSHAITGVPEDVLKDSLRANLSAPRDVSPLVTIRSLTEPKLLNVGFLQSTALYDYQCFVFHDIDLVPVDDRNVYTCPQQPRHMSVLIDYKSGAPYVLMFGGVSALSKELMVRVNGYSNIYWGWGGEDDDMTFRLKHINQTILRRPANIAKYKSLSHALSKRNEARIGILKKWKDRYQTDGLNSVKYKVLNMEFKKLYTWILVDLRD
ncbi:hypothetical protein MTO96_023680 [Rhipicephalus appendiculatus]